MDRPEAMEHRGGAAHDRLRRLCWREVTIGLIRYNRSCGGSIWGTNSAGGREDKIGPEDKFSHDGKARFSRFIVNRVLCGVCMICSMLLFYCSVCMFRALNGGIFGWLD